MFARSQLFCTYLGAGLLVSLALPVGGAWLTDVSQTQFDRVTDTVRGDRSGQTFMAQSDGLMAGVRLLVQGGTWGNGYPAGSDTVVRLRSLGPNGVPLETPLTQGMLHRADVDRDTAKWVTVLFDSPYQQTTGEMLAIMVEDLTSGANGWNNYGMHAGNPYPLGQAFHLDWSEPFKMAQLNSSNFDFAFETVMVPEPIFGITIVSGSLLLVRRRR